MSNTIKAVFFDIDGTLIDRQGGPYKDDLKAMEEAVNQGHLLFINTGRSFANIPDLLLEFPLWSGIGAGGGAHVLMKQSAQPLYKTIYHKWVDEDLVCKICAWYLERDICFILEGERDCYVINPLDRQHKLKIITRPDDIPVKYPGDLITKMTMIGAISRDDTKFLEENFQINLFPDYAEAIIKDENKAKAMGIILDAVGIKRENSIALGDGANDIDMLRFAGLGVAMGNAIPELKAIAAFVTKNCGQGGAAEMLRRFVLG